jgi:hypothetical protein
MAWSSCGELPHIFLGMCFSMRESAHLGDGMETGETWLTTVRLSASRPCKCAFRESLPVEEAATDPYSGLHAVSVPLTGGVWFGCGVPRC